MFLLKKIKYLIIFFLFTLVIIGLTNYVSQQDLTVYYDDQKIDNVRIYSDYIQNEENIPKNSVAIADIKSSGQKIRLQKKHYIIRYSIKKGYRNPDIAIELKDKPLNRTINPYMDESSLSVMLDKEYPIIYQYLVTKYGENKINNYTVKKGKLYRNGNWYGTTLQYKGDDKNIADTLRIILLKKDDRSWTNS